MLLPRTDDRVSSADFIRRFANWRIRSVRKPVVVTHHGRDAHVLLSHEEYQRLFDNHIGETKTGIERSLPKLVNNLRDGILILDHDRQILSVNLAACEMVQIDAASAIGMSFEAAFPQVSHDHLYGHIVRMLCLGESYVGDSNLIRGAGRNFHVQLVPVKCGGAIIMRDNSDEMANYQQNQIHRAILQAVSACGGIGYAQLSLRGLIVSADQHLLTALNVRNDAIKKVRFSTLMPLDLRQNFNDTLEAVLDGEESSPIPSALVQSSGDRLSVRLSVTALRGPFACEGAMVIVTFPDQTQIKTEIPKIRNALV